MPKFKVQVSKSFYVEHIVEADDKDHALEIAAEIEDFMRCDWTTHIDSEWDAVEAGDEETVDYEPVQDYLK